MSETNISRYRAEDLEAWVADAFAAVGTTPADAKETARVLVRTNLRGIDTHGVARVPGYVEKIRSGEVNTAPTPSSSIRSEERTSELQSLMRISYAVFCLKKKKTDTQT